MFAFPLQVGAARLGALTLYQDRAGPLGDDTYADALVMAEIVTLAFLAMQSGLPDGVLADELGDAGAYRAEIHQASGMVSVQLDINVGEALVRLRARAMADNTTVAHLAAKVISRQLQFTAVTPRSDSRHWASPSLQGDPSSTTVAGGLSPDPRIACSLQDQELPRRRDAGATRWLVDDSRRPGRLVGRNRTCSGDPRVVVCEAPTATGTAYWMTARSMTGQDFEVSTTRTLLPLQPG